ncbi:MAG: hypothetical protein LBF55_05630, partial [Prevotellaceae bacterium]|nr:hypothetical protein [Prevotellaceae bacterium]
MRTKDFEVSDDVVESRAVMDFTPGSGASNSENPKALRWSAIKAWVKSMIPASLKNPHSLTFTGAATGSYDGSNAETVNIPVAPTKLPTPRSLDGILFDGSDSVTRCAYCYTIDHDPDKEVSVSNFELEFGAMVMVKFYYGNTADNLTLNVEGTGKFPILFHGRPLIYGDIEVDEVYIFVFDFDSLAYRMVGESHYTYDTANAANANANTAINDSFNAKTTANSIAGTANQAVSTANQAVSTANDAKSTVNVADGKASAALASLSSPTGMELSYPASVSVRNAALQRIEARLLPAFTKQDCAIFLPAGGDAIDLYPDGTFRVQQLGTSRVYVVPTLAASAYKTVDITVRPAYLRRTGSGGLRLTGA